MKFSGLTASLFGLGMVSTLLAGLGPPSAGDGAQPGNETQPKTQSAPNFALVGFAAVPGHGTNGTTGGGDAPPIAVRTAEEFQSAVLRLDIKDKKLHSASPRVVLVAADIDLSTLANEKPGREITSVGKVRIASHTTIYAAGAGRTIRRGVLDTHGGHNIIIRNLKFRDLWENDPSGSYDSLGWDYIRITNSGKTTSHHIWIDRCDFGKVYDGMIDITHGSDLVTISWCRFAGDERGPQKKVMLIGHSSSATAAARDRGRLNVTLHHNWFQNIEDRAPRARFGNIHVFNNFVDGARYATMSVAGAVSLVENSVYSDTLIATSFSHDKDAVSRNLGGTLCLVNSLNLKPRPRPSSGDAGKQFEIEHNFQSNVSRENLQFNVPGDFAWEDRNRLPYDYEPDSVEQVPTLVAQYAGAGKVSEAAQ